MDLIAAYEKLKTNGYVLDQYSFDQQWLDRKPGYTAYIRSTETGPSIETLMRLYFRLQEHEQKEARWGLDTGVLSNLAETMFAEVQQRCRS